MNCYPPHRRLKGAPEHHGKLLHRYPSCRRLKGCALTHRNSSSSYPPCRWLYGQTELGDVSNHCLPPRRRVEGLQRTPVPDIPGYPSHRRFGGGVDLRDPARRCYPPCRRLKGVAHRAGKTGNVVIRRKAVKVVEMKCISACFGSWRHGSWRGIIATETPAHPSLFRHRKQPSR